MDVLSVLRGRGVAVQRLELWRTTLHLSADRNGNAAWHDPGAPEAPPLGWPALRHLRVVDLTVLYDHQGLVTRVSAEGVAVQAERSLGSEGLVGTAGARALTVRSAGYDVLDGVPVELSLRADATQRGTQLRTEWAAVGGGPAHARVGVAAPGGGDSDPPFRAEVALPPGLVSAGSPLLESAQGSGGGAGVLLSIGGTLRRPTLRLQLR